MGDGGNLHLLVEHRRDPEVPDVIRADRVFQPGALGGECLKDVLVRVAVEPDFASTWVGRVTSLGAGASHAFGHVPLQPSPKFLAERTDRVAGTITVSVSASGQELKQETARIDVLASGEWGGLRSPPKVLAAFVTPNHPTGAPHRLKGCCRARPGCCTRGWCVCPWALLPRAGLRRMQNGCAWSLLRRNERGDKLDIALHF